MRVDFYFDRKVTLKVTLKEGDRGHFSPLRLIYSVKDQIYNIYKYNNIYFFILFFIWEVSLWRNVTDSYA